MLKNLVKHEWWTDTTVKTDENGWMEVDAFKGDYQITVGKIVTEVSFTDDKEEVIMISYQTHWHSYGEILLVGPGDTNIYSVGKNTYELVPDDLVIVWPMEMHSIVDADRTEGSCIYIATFISYALRLIRSLLQN